jgi:hypothetical protein
LEARIAIVHPRWSSRLSPIATLLPLLALLDLLACFQACLLDWLKLA